VPDKFSLEQNFPNPFNPSTTINWTAYKSCKVALKAYNLRGELVKTLEDGIAAPGAHSTRWEGTDETGRPASAGLYLYVLDADGKRVGKKKAMMFDGENSPSGGFAGSAAQPLIKVLNPDWYDVTLTRVNYETKTSTVEINDGSGPIEFTYLLTRNNQTPVVKADVNPKQVKVGQPVNLTDLGSFDPDGDPFTYDWETEGVHYTTPNATHTLSTPGDKPITLTLTDDRGASNKEEFIVSVAEL
jgi:hypothetical protein